MLLLPLVYTALSIIYEKHVFLFLLVCHNDMQRNTDSKKAKKKSEKKVKKFFVGIELH